MRALVQRVTSASVRIDGKVRGEIGLGLLVFLGVGQGDGVEQVEKLFAKISKMRIFADAAGKTNLSMADVGASMLVVSQFTLFADCKRGNRPSFTQAGAPTEANLLYEHFIGLARGFVAGYAEKFKGGETADVVMGLDSASAKPRPLCCSFSNVPQVATGEFGADMKVSLENDGPFTIWLDTEYL